MDDGHYARESGSAPTNPSRTRWWTRVIDGTRPWGAIDLWPNKYGFRKYRLVVFPPGISPSERRYVRLARSWPTWGAALWLLLAIGLSYSGRGWTTLVYPTAAFLLSGAIVVTLSRGAHSTTRTMSAVIIDGHDDPEFAARYAQLRRLTHTLVAADALLSRGELTVVEHEAVWWSVYDALDQESTSHV